ncbi:MAG: chorismate synthase [Lachnospiraceae bacterium]|nr:chorismate synthase [Lachnospiraceae bacterium]
MKNTFGNSLSITLFGESHGPYTGAVLDGLAPGMDIDVEFIKDQLLLRRPSGKISTKRVEADEFSFASGVYNGKTTGTPLCILIPNTVQKSADYGEETERPARPGHADFTARMKYHGFEDYRGGGHFSGRITAALVAAGAVVIPALKDKGIVIGTHIKSLGDIKDRDFSDYGKDIEVLSHKVFAVLDENAEKQMVAKIEDTAAKLDSIGGVLETVVYGMPAGVGEPWFDSVESVLSHGLYSIPGIKGVQFGAGFDLAGGYGSEFNDAFYNDNGNIRTKSNNNGGINGGITNGMPIIIRSAVKPTPSIYKEQDTVLLDSGKDTKLSIQGRHDPTIIHRARVVVDSMTALCVYDLLASRFGTDFFKGDK